MATPDRCPRRRRAVTLIELLVVVAVLAILLAAVLNLMQPVVKEMKVRESARMVDSFLSGAQARAKELGRPVAVYIEPFVRRATDGSETATGAAYQMFIAETPPPFAGDTMNAEATVDESSRSQATLAGATMLDNYQDDELVGGFIRFGFRGHFYEIKSRTGTTVTFLTSESSDVDAGDPAHYKLPPAPGKSPYQVFPRPIKTSVSPLDIPEPLAIDIQNSGFYEESYREFDLSKKPVIIAFAPSGAIDRIYAEVDGETEEVHQPTGAVHLLVGWAGKLGADNLADFTVRWVSISHATGRIITSENAGGSNPREFAEDALGMGSGS